MLNEISELYDTQAYIFSKLLAKEVVSSVDHWKKILGWDGWYGDTAYIPTAHAPNILTTNQKRAITRSLKRKSMAGVYGELCIIYGKLQALTGIEPNDRSVKQYVDDLVLYMITSRDKPEAVVFETPLENVTWQSAVMVEVAEHFVKHPYVCDRRFD